MMSLCMVIGYVGQDPVIKQTPNGKSYLQLSIGVTDSYSKDKKTSWFRITFWDKQALNINQFVRKGSKVYCECRPYETEVMTNGEMKRFWNFNGNSCVFLDDKKQDNQVTQQKSETIASTEFDEDVPF